MHSLLSAQDEKALLKSAVEGERAAIAALVEHNQALVTRIARRYYLAGSYQTMEDLIQWGNIGLLRAIAKWDARRGRRFSTYATYWIRAVIRRNASHGTVFSMSDRDSQFVARVCRAKSTLLESLQREPDPEEIARRAGLPLSAVLRSLAVLDRQIDIDGEGGGNESEPAPVIESVIKVEAHSTEAEAEDRVLIGQIRVALQNLSPVQQRVISRRYLDGAPAPLRELSAELNVSEQYVSQVERDALRRLRELIGSIELSK